MKLNLTRLQNWAKSALKVGLVLVALFSWTGCGGPEVANKSSRPWNTPKSWEHGLPTGITEGR